MKIDGNSRLAPPERVVRRGVLPWDITRCTSELCRDRYHCLRWLDAHTGNPMKRYSDFLEDYEMTCKYIITA